VGTGSVNINCIAKHVTMTVGPLVFELVVVFCVSVLLLHHYGRITKQHPSVTIATLVAWYFSLIIVFILPLDVSSVSWLVRN